MSNEKFEILVTKILSSEATKEEIKQFDDYIKDEEYFLKYNWLKDQLNNVKNQTSPDFNYERGLKSLRSKINNTEKNKKQSGQYFGTLNKRIIAIAASIIVLTTLIFLVKDHFISNPINYTEYSTVTGERIQLKLHDNSVLYLNSCTKVKISDNFKKNRKIILDGEAYFEVTKNQHVPFIVETKNTNVTVVGTSFNVYSFANRPEIISVLTGKVKVENKQNNSSELLNPNEKVTLVKDKFIKTNIGNPDFIFGWTEEKLVFDNESLEEVRDKLEKWYGIQIKLKIKEPVPEKITGTYTNLNIQELMKLLQYSLPIQYKFNNKTLIINNKD